MTGIEQADLSKYHSGLHPPEKDAVPLGLAVRVQDPLLDDEQRGVVLSLLQDLLVLVER